MRLLTRLKARAATEYDNTYHNNLRGCVWRGLDGTKYAEKHDEPVPLGYCFSNPFPWGDLEEGDTRHVIISAVEEELLAHVAREFLDNPELNIGEMPFTIEDVSEVTPDVGEPGTTGVIQTDTGVCVRLSPEQCEEYGIDEGYDEADTYWRPRHSMEPFLDAIAQNAQWKHEMFGPDATPGPEEMSHDLFTGYEHIRNFSIPVTVSRGVTTEIVLSKWRFDYEVQNDAHRKHLNMLLDTGLGERNGFGFGFCNIVEKGGEQW